MDFASFMDDYEEKNTPPDGTFVAKIVGYENSYIQGFRPAKKVRYKADNGFEYTQLVGDFDTWKSGKTNYTRIQFMRAVGWDRANEMPDTDWVLGVEVVVKIVTNGEWQNVDRVSPFTTGASSVSVDV